MSISCKKQSLQISLPGPPDCAFPSTKRSGKYTRHNSKFIEDSIRHFWFHSLCTSLLNRGRKGPWGHPGCCPSHCWPRHVADCSEWQGESKIWAPVNWLAVAVTLNCQNSGLPALVLGKALDFSRNSGQRCWALSGVWQRGWVSIALTSVQSTEQWKPPKFHIPLCWFNRTF